MSLIVQALAWLLDGANWVGDGGLAQQLLDHLVLTALALALALVLALPLGLYIGHTGRLRRSAVPVANVLRALPTLGLLSLLVVGLDIDIWAVVIVLALLGVPPLLAGAYAGLESVDPVTVDAARAQGMTEWQILTLVELPLGLPILLGGLRGAVVQIFATATLAFYFGFDSLGNAVLTGVASGDYAAMLGGAVLVTLGALALDGVLAVLQRLAGPRGVSRGTGGGTTATARGRRPNAATASIRTPVTESD